MLVMLAVSIFSNIYLVYTSQMLIKEKMNILGGLLIQSRSLLDEPIDILNVTVRETRIEFALWNVLFEDLIQLSRQFTSVIAADSSHGLQWSQIKQATDLLLGFVHNLAEKYAKNNTYLDINPEQSQYFNSIIDYLTEIELRAFPTVIVIGSDPQVNIDDRGITEALLTSIQLQATLVAIAETFNLRIDVWQARTTNIQ
jgi:hypothetical protein